jgi:hypothetical protein
MILILKEKVHQSMYLTLVKGKYQNHQPLPLQLQLQFLKRNLETMIKKVLELNLIRIQMLQIESRMSKGKEK